MSDLFPHIQAWERAAKKSKNITWIDQPVDASKFDSQLMRPWVGEDQKVFRLFNLAFHHFDDPLAKAILKNTVDQHDGFA